MSYQGASQLVSAVTQPDAHTVYFTYDDGRLADVQFPDATDQQFAYADGWMSSEVLRDGRQYTTECTDMRRKLKIEGGGTSQEVIDEVYCPAGFPQSRAGEPAHGWLAPPCYVDRTDARGNTWRLFRDALGRLSSQTSPLDTSPPSPPRRFSRYYAYDDDNRLAYIRNELGALRHLTYDQRGNILTRTDEAGNTETFTYDDTYTRLLTRTEPHGETDVPHVWNYAYYTNGDLCTVTDPAQNATLIEYTDYTGGRVHTVTVTDRNGNKTRYEYDEQGNPVSITRGYTDSSGGLNLITSYTYNAMGRPLSRTVDRGDGTASVTSWTYDEVGRVLTKTEHMAGTPADPDLVTGYTWDGCGHLTTVTDPRGVVTNYDYDYRGRLCKMTADYAPEGVAGHLNLVTQWTLDGNGNVVSVTDPSGAATTYAYNPQNFLTSITDAAYYQTNLQVDGAGRVLLLERQLEPQGAVFYTVQNQYDPINRLLSRMVDPGAGGLNITTSYQYTPTAGCGSCSGATPGTARPNRIIDPDLKYTYVHYDELNRVTDVIRKVADTGEAADDDDAVSHYEYDNEGKLLAVLGPEGERANFEYDAANRRTLARTYTDEDDNSIELHYQYDGADNITGITRADGSQVTLTYDLANRLLTASDGLYPTDPPAPDLLSRTCCQARRSAARSTPTTSATA